MKKIIAFIIFFVLIIASIAFCEDYDVTVKVNGTEVVSDVNPILQNGRTYLPLRAVLNSIGVPNENIHYWEKSNAVEIRHNDTHIFMVINSHEVIINDVMYRIDAPPFETNGRTMVPIRFLSENLNCKVEWDESTFTVNIYTT